MDPVVNRHGPQGRGREGERDERDREPVPEHLCDREAHPVDGDGTLRDDVGHEPPRRPDPEAATAHTVVLDQGHLADGIDVTLHQVAAQRITDPEREFEVDTVALGEIGESAAVTGLT